METHMTLALYFASYLRMQTKLQRLLWDCDDGRILEASQWNNRIASNDYNG